MYVFRAKWGQYCCDNIITYLQVSYDALPTTTILVYVGTSISHTEGKFRLGNDMTYKASASTNINREMTSTIKPGVLGTQRE
jgi:hypothetical protein